MRETGKKKGKKKKKKKPVQQLTRRREERRVIRKWAQNKYTCNNPTRYTRFHREKLMCTRETKDTEIPLSLTHTWANSFNYSSMTQDLSVLDKSSDN